MTTIRFFPVVLTSALLALSGCTLVPVEPVLYRLDSGELVEVAVKDRPLTVQLEPIAVADYLNSEQLVQRQSDDSLIVARHARWAGPLGSNLSEQLVRQLGVRLQTDKLVLAPVPAGFKADLQARVDVTRFDAGPTQPAVLEARWRLLDRLGEVRGTRLLHLHEPHAGSIADQVRAQHVLLQRLAEDLAQAINAQPLPTSQASAKPSPVAPAARSKPRAPLPAPIRTDVEVFRF